MVEKLSLLSSYKQIKRLNIEDGNNNILTYDPLISLTTIIKAVNNHKNIAFKYISYDIDDNCLS